MVLFQTDVPQERVPRMNMFQAQLSLPILLLWRDLWGYHGFEKASILAEAVTQQIGPLPSR